MDLGIAVDHLIFGYDAKLDTKSAADVPGEWKFRQDLTIEFAAEFSSACTGHAGAGSNPWPWLTDGAHGPTQRRSVTQLQDIGYDRIALGGMVPLKTPDILDTLKVISVVLDPSRRNCTSLESRALRTYKTSQVSV